MIIGRDLLDPLQIDISYRNQNVTWDERSIPLKDVDCTVDSDFYTQEPASTDEATERIKNILDANALCYTMKCRADNSSVKRKTMIGLQERSGALTKVQGILSHKTYTLLAACSFRIIHVVLSCTSYFSN